MMSSVSIPLLLFVHIVSALGLFVVEGVAFFALRELRDAAHLQAARAAMGRLGAVERLGQPLPVLALLSGLGLCALAWGFTRPWVLLSLAGFVGLAVLIRTVDHPRVTRLQQQLAGPLTPDQLWPAVHDPALPRGSRLRLGLLLWLVFLMTVKPALVIGLGVLVLVIAGALLAPLPRATPAPAAS